MTDNEIIIDLHGSILNAKSFDCKVWSLEVYKLENALDLINRQKEEIERLSIESETLLTQLKGAYEQIHKLNMAKSEAIKEFAERLKEEIRCEDDCGYHCYGCGYECKDYVIAVDNLVKEMTEVENDRA